jgi:hypothetical protein
MKALNLLFVCAILVGASACSMITSSQPSASNVTGEAWFTKTRVFIIPYATDVYYCDGKGNTCKAAQMKSN